MVATSRTSAIRKKPAIEKDESASKRKLEQHIEKYAAKEAEPIATPVKKARKLECDPAMLRS